MSIPGGDEQAVSLQEASRQLELAVHDAQVAYDCIALGNLDRAHTHAITARTGRLSSRHQVTSVMSPKVQIIAMPLPFSGSASACAFTGTRTPKSGVTTSVPNSGL